MYSFPSEPPRPSWMFWDAKKRFVDSRTANWIETQTPIPRSGVRVPLVDVMLEYLGFQMGRRCVGSYLVEGKGALIS